MDLNTPAHLDVARLPTPLEQSPRIGREAGLDLWLKRDDLTGIALSGNKVRKLEFLAAAAMASDADTLLTCGAVNSNHARATAVVAARLGMRSHLVLRGEEPSRPEGNFLLDRLLGAGVTFITQEQWQGRDAIMDEVATRLRAKGQRPYAIPEGGSNAIGAMGYARAVQELLEQGAGERIRIRRIVHATGSGGTTAGLALGCAAADRIDIDVLGVAVCDDRAYFDERVGSICDAAAASGFVSDEVRAQARWTIVEGYKGRGYGRTSPEEMARIADVARTEGILLDPVYSGKAFLAMLDEAKAGRLEGEGATIFVHTGGIFGLFAFGEEIEALSPQD